jgi:hypothetical protein
MWYEICRGIVVPMCCLLFLVLVALIFFKPDIDWEIEKFRHKRRKVKKIPG